MPDGAAILGHLRGHLRNEVTETAGWTKQTFPETVQDHLLGIFAGAIASGLHAGSLGS